MYGSIIVSADALGSGETVDILVGNAGYTNVVVAYIDGTPATLLQRFLVVS